MFLISELFRGQSDSKQVLLVMVIKVNNKSNVTFSIDTNTDHYYYYYYKPVCPTAGQRPPLSLSIFPVHFVPLPIPSSSNHPAHQLLSPVPSRYPHIFTYLCISLSSVNFFFKLTCDVICACSSLEADLMPC